MTDAFTLGVEEELQLLDASTLALASRADDLLAMAPTGELLSELPRSQVEAVTTVCGTLDEVREQVIRRRGIAAAAAIAADLRIASCGTAPLAEWRVNSYRLDPPYDQIATFAGHLIREQLIAGLHVHVGIEDPERATAVLDRIRDWLPVLSALSASSPYWAGLDSGYSSFRAVHWRRWPASGPPPLCGSAAGYAARVQALLDSGVLTRESQVYWDARRSARFPTVEVRVCDAVQTVDLVVALTGVIRGLAEMALRDHDAGVPLVSTQDDALRLAGWQAARHGLAGELIMPGTGMPQPAPVVVAALLERIRPVLRADADQVVPVIEETVTSGGGAERQRAAVAAALAADPSRGWTRALRAAAELVVAETVAGVSVPTLPRVAARGELDADERRLAADRPPHHG